LQLGLNGKRALVTGSTSGIGAAIAEMLAEEGVDVVLNGRDRERAGVVAQQLRAKGVNAHLALGDVGTDEGARDVARQAVDALGGIDILVNNAGGTAGTGGQSNWLDASLADWQATHSANTMAAVRLCQLLVPPMQERGWGRVIHISSVAGSEPGTQLQYGATKAALDNFSLGLSRKLARTGVTSNVIAPGMIKTPALESWFRTMAEQNGLGPDARRGEAYVLEHHVKQSVARFGVPEDIARMVAFLASPSSDFITGSLFRIDGGAARSM
jgi:Dehydrogenases with different specificities (related to short-chain alcohol dehydrogenases)